MYTYLCVDVHISVCVQGMEVCRHGGVQACGRACCGRQVLAGRLSFGPQLATQENLAAGTHPKNTFHLIVLATNLLDGLVPASPGRAARHNAGLFIEVCRPGKARSKARQSKARAWA